MSEIIKVCTERVLPLEKRVAAAKRAIEENPANAAPRLRGPMVGVLADEPLRIAILTGKMWKPGRTLRVHFLDGLEEIQKKVEPYAHEWSTYANVNFKFGYDPSAEIRISFEREGSWSYVGTDSLQISRGEPTMNFGWLTPSTEDAEYSRVVLHEFGHSLGAIHEHSHPLAEIPWNKPACYDYYGRQGWPPEEVDRQVFARYSKEETNFSAYDKTSIMHYAVPKELTDGVFEVGWNRVLSEMDRTWIAGIYPYTTQVTMLKVGADPLAASIGQHQEQDLFELVVDQKGHYVIETDGNTDVFMSLFGPDSRTQLIAEDDDSGRKYNAKIAAELNPGTYFIQVRHYRPTGTGDYKISARRE